MAEVDGRTALARLIEERGEDYAGLSRLIGRNPAYIQQFIKRGTPRRLAEADRRILARYFGVDEARWARPRRRPGRGCGRCPGSTWTPRPAPAPSTATNGAAAISPSIPPGCGGWRAARRSNSRSSGSPAIPWRRPWPTATTSSSTGRFGGAAARRHLCAQDRGRAGGETAGAQSGGAHLVDPLGQSRLSGLARLRSGGGGRGRAGGLGGPADRLISVSGGGGPAARSGAGASRPIPAPARKPMLGWPRNTPISAPVSSARAEQEAAGERRVGFGSHARLMAAPGRRPAPTARRRPATGFTAR